VLRHLGLVGESGVHAWQIASVLERVPLALLFARDAGVVLSEADALAWTAPPPGPPLSHIPHASAPQLAALVAEQQAACAAGAYDTLHPLLGPRALRAALAVAVAAAASSTAIQTRLGLWCVQCMCDGDAV
jgi:hypothetical protein